VVSAVTAIGGELWLARTDPSRVGQVQVYKVTTTGVIFEELRIDGSTPGSGASASRWSIAASAAGGWLTSGDFYAQDPSVPRTRSTVNAGSASIGVELGRAVGAARLSVGADTAFTLGAHHVARYGDRSTRLRPYLFGAVGFPWLQLTGGYLFPHHPAIGARAAVPLAGPLHLTARFTYGFASTRPRSDGTTWEGHSATAASVGVEWRASP
jgi:hypothetical protein